MSYHAPFHKTIKRLKGPYIIWNSIISRQQSYGIGCQKWQSAYLIYGCSIIIKLSSGVKLTWTNIFIVTLSAESAENVIKITQGKLMQNCLNYQWTLPTYFFCVCPGWNSTIVTTRSNMNIVWDDEMLWYALTKLSDNISRCICLSFFSLLSSP